jgi:hypothetical protein
LVFENYLNFLNDKDNLEQQTISYQSKMVDGKT